LQVAGLGDEVPGLAEDGMACQARKEAQPILSSFHLANSENGETEWH
jgi:hypothetical protein